MRNPNTQTELGSGACGRCVEMSGVPTKLRGVTGNPSRTKWRGSPAGGGDAGLIQERRWEIQNRSYFCLLLHPLADGPTCLLKETRTPSVPDVPLPFHVVKTRPTTQAWIPPHSPAQVPPLICTHLLSLSAGSFPSGAPAKSSHLSNFS